jgi:hypothetical protein
VSKTFTALRLLIGSLVLLLGALLAPTQAQQFNGTLRGVVQDSTGGVLPGASGAGGGRVLQIGVKAMF